MGATAIRKDRIASERLTQLFREGKYTPKEKKALISRLCGGKLFMTELSTAEKEAVVDFLEKEARTIAELNEQEEKIEQEGRQFEPGLDNYGGTPTWMDTLPVGVKFFVNNGHWAGCIIDVEGVKHMLVGEEHTSDSRLINLEVHQDVQLSITLKEAPDGFELPKQGAPVTAHEAKELTVAGIQSLVKQVRADLETGEVTFEDIGALCDILDSVLAGEDIEPEEESIDYGELYAADPDCKHNIVGAPGGGVKCTKCPAWFCF